MTDRTTAYFDDLVERSANATAIARTPTTKAKPNDCHTNCERHVEMDSNFDIVRGWLTIERHLFIPHSVLRERSSGRLVDIAPDGTDNGAIPFIEHIGSEEDFSILKGRDGGWVHPQPTELPRDFATLPISIHPRGDR